MPRFVYKGTLDNYTDMRFVADDYVPAPGETVAQGDVLPAMPWEKIKAKLEADAAKLATLDDIVAVLPANLQAAIQARIQARIAARKSA